MDPAVMYAARAAEALARAGEAEDAKRILDNPRLAGPFLARYVRHPEIMWPLAALWLTVGGGEVAMLPSGPPPDPPER